ncbi:hypothetical protein UPYG_G00174980 [Umbra pygmaea]|uniref:Uncharacterized protein n=1 Tax=Umbra pygmaea TaxID=75934 RepID=A0ABD0WPV0_UMBPY
MYVHFKHPTLQTGKEGESYSAAVIERVFSPILRPKSLCMHNTDRLQWEPQLTPSFIKVTTDGAIHQVTSCGPPVFTVLNPLPLLHPFPCSSPGCRA